MKVNKISGRFHLECKVSFSFTLKDLLFDYFTGSEKYLYFIKNFALLTELESTFYGYKLLIPRISSISRIFGPDAAAKKNIFRAHFY
jgi:hypothetical protein